MANINDDLRIASDSGNLRVSMQVVNEEVASDDDIITGGDETTWVAGGGEVIRAAGDKVTQIPVDSELLPDQVQIANNNTVANPQFNSGNIPEFVQFQEGLAMYLNSLVPSKEQSAVVAEMKRSTFIHRTLGRRSAADFGKSRRLLLEAEEKTLIWRCNILQRAGFPQTVKDVRDLAQTILRKRDPTGTISPQWIDRYFYKQHPEVKARWSQQLDKVRVWHANKFYALESFFKTVGVDLPLKYLQMINS